MAEKKWNLDDPKYDTLNKLLAAQGRDINEEIVAHLEALCEELVPKKKQERASEFPKDSFAVFRFCEGDDSFCFTSSDHLTLYDSGLRYLEAEQDGKLEFSFDTIAYEYYGADGMNVVNDVLFSSLIKAIAVDDRITAAIEYDFDNYQVKVYERDGESFKQYNLDDFSEAVEQSKLALVRTEIGHDKCLKQLLYGKEISTTEVTDEFPTMQI